jgi:hypothetical protein
VDESTKPAAQETRRSLHTLTENRPRRQSELAEFLKQADRRIRDSRAILNAANHTIDQAIISLKRDDRT